MNQKVCFTVVLLCLTQGTSALPHPQPYEDYYSDGEFDSYGDDYSATDYLNENEKVVHTIPQFTSEPLNIMVNEGETIKLPCQVDKLDEYVLMWKKSKEIITVDRQIVRQNDKRLSLEETPNGNILVISLAEPKDEGEYICQIGAARKTELRHNVKIRVAPQIQPNPANGILEVREGEPATLGCKITKGSPMPEIKWTRKDRTFHSGEKEIKGLELTFKKANRHHSGFYVCEANNGFRAASSVIQLDVQHAPTIEQDETYIHTREDDETEISCIVHASPKAEVTWYKDGRPLEDGEGIVSSTRNRHTLLLPGITQSTFGVYSCKAVNKFGSDEKTTEVSGKAGEASLKTEPVGNEKSRYTAEWVSESITPVTAFKVQYRPYNPKLDRETGWNDEIRVNGVKVNGDRLYSGKHIFEGLAAAKHYEVRISSSNDYGFSQWSLPVIFGTKGADMPIHQPSTDANAASTSSLALLLILAPLLCLFH